MSNSLEIYKEILAAENPAGLKNYYLQLVTTIFYELTTKKTSPLISFFCQMNIQNFTPKNFQLQPAQIVFNRQTSFDMYVIIFGFNVAIYENLDSALKVYEIYKQNIFRGVPLQENYFQALIKNLAALDEGLGKFLKKPDPDKDFLQNLNALSENRHAADEKIIAEIKKIQLALQEELPRLQGTLKTISDIRDGIDFKATAEPINQLIQLFDKLHETLQRHPQADAQKGYEILLRRCKNFSRFIEQALAMLGAQLIKEINIPLNPDMHEISDAVRPSAQAKVSKILRVGLIYKGQILRKAEVEIVEPENFFGGKSS